VNITAAARTWLFTDGAAGNVRQAEALAAALAVSPTSFRVESRPPWRWFAPRWVPSDFNGLGIDARPPWPELAIGCGRQGALALRTLSRLAGDGVRTVQILDPRIDPMQFDLVVVPAHDAVRAPNVIVTRGALHPVDEVWLERARHEWRALGALPGPRTAVLLGGPNRALTLDDAYWRGLATTLGKWIHRDGGSLLLTTSRRSPDWLRDAARAEFGDVPGLQWHGPDDGPNPYAGLLAWADRIVVTPDSINLLSEACATSVPVLCHVDRPVRGKHARFLGGLVDAGRIRQMRAEYSAWEVQPSRELQAVAERIRVHLAADAPRS
jgi:mitochondrial fission protein ELM1